MRPADVLVGFASMGIQASSAMLVDPLNDARFSEQEGEAVRRAPRGTPSSGGVRSLCPSLTLLPYVQIILTSPRQRRVDRGGRNGSGV